MFLSRGIYFENKLLRGNRTYKFNAAHFDAFKSPNYPDLATAGIRLNYSYLNIQSLPAGPLKVHKKLDASLSILILFPGISRSAVKAILDIQGIRAVVMESYGSGNAMTSSWFISLLRKRIGQGLIVLNISQCRAGMVEQGLYETSASFDEIGVVGGTDITREAAVTKLMFLLGKYTDRDLVIEKLGQSLRGEISVSSP